MCVVLHFVDLKYNSALSKLKKTMKNSAWNYSIKLNQRGKYKVISVITKLFFFK